MVRIFLSTLYVAMFIIMLVFTRKTFRLTWFSSIVVSLANPILFIAICLPDKLMHKLARILDRVIPLNVRKPKKDDEILGI